MTLPPGILKSRRGHRRPHPGSAESSVIVENGQRLPSEPGLPIRQSGKQKTAFGCLGLCHRAWGGCSRALVPGRQWRLRNALRKDGPQTSATVSQQGAQAAIPAVVAGVNARGAITRRWPAPRCLAGQGCLNQGEQTKRHDQGMLHGRRTSCWGTCSRHRFSRAPEATRRDLSRGGTGPGRRFAAQERYPWLAAQKRQHWYNATKL
jgi:hypothetical protein